MKDAASTAQREQNQRQGLIVGTITLPFRLLGVLIGSLLFSIVVECVGMHLFWKDQGWRHSQQMLQYELGHLSNHFTRSVVVQEPGRTAHELVDTGYEWVFVRSGLPKGRVRAAGEGDSLQALATREATRESLRSGAAAAPPQWLEPLPVVADESEAAWASRLAARGGR